MRLSEAILLGDSLKKSNPNVWLKPDGSCGCAFGGALLAAGCKPAVYAEQVIAAGIAKNPNAEAQLAELPCVKSLWAWLTAGHLRNISQRYYSVASGYSTIESVADYVRTIEPDEPAESVENSQEVNSEKVTHAL